MGVAQELAEIHEQFFVARWGTREFDARGTLDQEGHIECPRCKADTFRVEWWDPDRGCAGGTLNLECTACGVRWQFYDDCA